jgi:hypothetical protein
MEHQGGFFLLIPAITLFIIILTEIAREKEKKLRIGLSVMGLTPLEYYAHWFITILLLSLLQSLILVVFGIIFNFLTFKECPFIIL